MAELNEEWRTRLVTKRYAGKVHLVLENRSDDVVEGVQAADKFVAGLGLHPIGEQWQQVERAMAQAIVTEVLHRDLAYHSELMPFTEAQSFADDFLASFGDDATYFTNGTFSQPQRETKPGVWQGPSWTPVRNVTFYTCRHQFHP